MNTEGVDRRFRDVDSWPVGKILDGLLDHQRAAIEAVARARPALERAVEAAAARLKGSEGRLVYVGAGTSGRLGVQDGVELTPTFSWPRARLVLLMAGGDAAFTRSVEGAEDDADAGAAAIAANAVGARDVAIAVAASGNTPFVVAAARGARAAGAITIGIACNPGSALLDAAQIPVLIETGPEALSGSTRLKAGTAQKAALNLFSTALMIRLGRVYGGLMVELQATNEKLRGRTLRILRRLSGKPEAEAKAALDAAGGSLKLALLLLDGVPRDEAERRLEAAAGNLRDARGR